MGERNGPAAPVITATAADRNRRVMRPARIALAWLAVIAVDLLANAGLLAPLFDQSREPSLLPDDVLARRSPVAFALLGIAVIALAWLLDASGARGVRAVTTGATAGAVLALVGVGGMWTAVGVTGAFVVAGVAVAGAEGGAAAAVLTSRSSGRRLTLLVASAFVLCTLLGQVAANLLGG